MLRVEASNLPSPPARARQLLPIPLGGERWSVRLELGQGELAKLYGQGLARGAVVWKKGMREWQPLLSTPELTSLLRSTRSTPSEAVTVPRSPRLPSIVPAELADQPVSPTTVSPTAMDVAIAPEAANKPRRPLELAAVAVAAFALAWLGHGALQPAHRDSAPASASQSKLSALPLPSCDSKPSGAAREESTSSSIPTIAVADLPLLGAANPRATLSRSGSRSSAGGAAGPKRSNLVGALSQVARAASGCGERGGPVRVVVTFANSGVARSIRVSGSDLPGATRSCIIGAASRARIPAFSGDPITVSKTL